MIAKIVTHPKPHPDEALAIWLLRNFGEDKFPGASTAQIVFCGGDPKEVAALAIRKDVLLIGIGGGRFDEHQGNGRSRKEGECAATLVARALLLDDDQVIKPLLEFVTKNDLEGGRSAFDIADVMSAMGRHGFADQEILNWSFVAFDAKASEQQRFIEEAGLEFSKAKILQIAKGTKHSITLAVIESDNDQVARYARWKRCGVVVQKCTTGNVQIFTDRRANVSLVDLARILRVEEQIARRRIRVTDFDALSEERVDEVPEWYYHAPAEMLLNGSITAPDVPPTKIPLVQIVECVKIALDHGRWPKSHTAQCEKGKCTASGRNPCPFYNWGLRRCRYLRSNPARNHSEIAS